MKQWLVVALVLLGLAGVSTAIILVATDEDLPKGTATYPTEGDEPSESPTTQEGSCSAARTDLDAEAQAGLPGEVSIKRIEILELALACDYEHLEELALEGDARFGFTYSYGDSGDPAGYWEQLENEPKKRFREPVMSHLVSILGMSYCKQTFARGGNLGEMTQYQWPAASCDVPTDEQWEEVSSIYTDKQIRQMKRFGSYLGWRAGITEDGDWTFYVAGD